MAFVQKGTRRQAPTLCPQLGQYAQATPLTGQAAELPFRQVACDAHRRWFLSDPSCLRQRILCSVPGSPSRFPSRLLSPRPSIQSSGAHYASYPPTLAKTPCSLSFCARVTDGDVRPSWSKPPETVRGKRTSRLQGAWLLAEDADGRGPRPGLHCPLCLCPSSSASYSGPVIGFSHSQTV